MIGRCRSCLLGVAQFDEPLETLLGSSNAAQETRNTLIVDIDGNIILEGMVVIGFAEGCRSCLLGAARFDELLKTLIDSSNFVGMSDIGSSAGFASCKEAETKDRALPNSTEATGMLKGHYTGPPE
jgi:hypothetical protein